MSSHDRCLTDPETHILCCYHHHAWWWLWAVLDDDSGQCMKQRIQANLNEDKPLFIPSDFWLSSSPDYGNLDTSYLASLKGSLTLNMYRKSLYTYAPLSYCVLRSLSPPSISTQSCPLQRMSMVSAGKRKEIPTLKSIFHARKSGRVKWVLRWLTECSHSKTIPDSRC